jgi:hypothetical protein
MLSVASKLVRWVVQKLAGGALILVLGLAGCALWVYLRDNVDFDQWRQDTMRAINGQRTQLRTALTEVNQRLTDTSAKIAADKQRVQQADKVIAGLNDLSSTWDRYFGDRAQQQLNESRLASVTALRDSLQAEIQQLQERFTHTQWERDGLEIALGKQDAQLHAIEAKRSKLMHYVDRAWNYEVGRGGLRLAIKWWIAIVLGLYFVGPTLGKVTLYFLVAPWIARGRPVRLDASATTLPQVGESRAAAEVGLGPGERLWVKERFLQASDEGLRKQTRYLFDWRIPITCVATGLIELIEMTNPAPSGDTPAAMDQRITLSNQADPHSEIAIVTLPEGASLVLRPSFLAGAIAPADRGLRIRRRWQLWRWQAWVTLQFRFFEFVGPCRLIVAGSRGIRVENLADREGAAVPARRTNQDATVGFTPNLDYRPVRAETFWSYYRGMNPLFDDLFAGRGIFLCQQVATEGEAKQARKFWSALWSGVMKVFGL